ncbi:hypothetical protein VNO77_34483 [Canavalia gladiata]|uniref:Uncharacterized protein n=1 Tax=Canavalia gladiata TaxID=3824 RepID=A0AAN9KFL4_CANGL
MPLRLIIHDSLTEFQVIASSDPVYQFEARFLSVSGLCISNFSVGRKKESRSQVSLNHFSGMNAKHRPPHMKLDNVYKEIAASNKSSKSVQLHTPYMQAPLGQLKMIRIIANPCNEAKILKWIRSGACSKPFLHKPAARWSHQGSMHLIRQTGSTMIQELSSGDVVTRIQLQSPIDRKLWKHLIHLRERYADGGKESLNSHRTYALAALKSHASDIQRNHNKGDPCTLRREPHAILVGST